MTGEQRDPRRWTVHLLWPVGVAMVAASEWLLRANPYTTIGGLGGFAPIALVGAAALVAAAVVAAGGGRRRLAVAAATTGLLWMVPEWEGWVGAPDALRVLAGAAAAVVPAAAVVVVAELGRVARPARRAVVTAAAAGAAAVAVARAVLIDPFRMVTCLRFCGHNPLLVGDLHQAGRVVESVGVVTGLASMVAVVGLAVLRVAVARTRRPLFDPAPGLSLAGGVLILCGLAVAAIPQGTIFESNPNVLWISLFGGNVGALAVSLGLALERMRDRRLRRTLTRVVDELRATPDPGSLQAALADVLRDPQLRLLYWAQGRGGYVDAGGLPTTLPDDEGANVSRIVRQGRPVAVVVHSAAVDGAQLTRAIAPAAMLAVENAQLRAATLAELAEVKASRARIVERADAERRRLERNLHDGAQQRVVGLALLLRMARGAVGASPTSAVLDQAADAVAEILAELRRLARGIHPAVLTDDGLAAALHDLAESSTDLAVRIDRLPEMGLPMAVEAAAYLVVSESIEDARTRGATHLIVTAVEVGRALVLDVIDDGRAALREHATADVADRVAALDGHLTIMTTDSCRTQVHLEVPCGW